ncbi:MAG: DUF1223 domain-containing protein [Boseongicola sp.]|nr:DUF1223 domain-containing protein [Boseongicola sp.]
MRLLVWCSAVWMAVATFAAADEPVVIELYTSQGCSSCPPADKMLAELSKRDDIIALALHVDYWDYIGWKDEFADPAHTVRQRGYSRAAGKRSIYTPQMVVGGVDHVLGARPMQLMDAIDAHRTKIKPASVTLRRESDRVAVSIRASGAMPSGGAVVQVATVTPTATVDIRRGENAGRTLQYHNIVRKLVEIGEWDGRGTYRASVKVPDGVRVVVLVQNSTSGPILGAAKID